MYAPQFFAQPQQLVPGFVQPYPPIFQTLDQGQKLDSSPLLILSGEKDEKRSLNDGLPGSSIDQSASGDDRIKQLEDQMGARAADNFDQTHPRPEVSDVNRNQYGGARIGPD